MERIRRQFWSVGNPMSRGGPMYDLAPMEQRLDRMWAEVRRLKTEQRSFDESEEE